ncbi:miraculin-like [Primulina tabacum]|uniref:miraculin-like n=1 Tax=Primulina tabacum TaxID=48773 RepID=UPI003F59F121
MIGADYELYDTGMEHLLADTPYYILPVQSGGGGGGGFYAYEVNATCYAVQQPFDDLPSRAVIFNPARPEDGGWISANKDLNIKFEYFFDCGSSSSGVLQVNTTDEATGQHFITAGGVEGNPGCGTITNWFQIEKLPSDYSYKLIYCPSVCDLVNVTCRDVGAFDQPGFGFLRLFLSD